MKSQYELLKTEETSKDLSEDFVKSFENALVSAYNNYVDSAQQKVDSFEDNAMELAYAKGFLAGCIHVDYKLQKLKDLAWALYESYNNLTNDSGRIRENMKRLKYFIIHEL